MNQLSSLLAAATTHIDRLDAEVLLAFVLSKPRSHLHAWPEREVGEAEAERFRALVERRAAGEPVAYLTGRREFWSLDLAVTEDTLIPRPETELLVELALERLPGTDDCAVADLGTGSGAIALAIAAERPDCRVVGCDRSAAALEVARANARRLGPTVDFRQGHWCEPLGDERFDLIVSNPPYIPAADPHLAQGDVRFEPRHVLAAGPEGLDDIRHLVEAVPAHLKPGGRLLVEHGYDQGPAVAALFRAAAFTEVSTHKDLEGRDRVCEGHAPAQGARGA